MSPSSTTREHSREQSAPARRARLARADLVALSFIWAVAFVLTWQTTVGDRALLPTDLYLRIQPWRAHAARFEAPPRVSMPVLDAVQQFYPWRLYASRQIRHGVVPLWTPHMLSGAPFVGNNQSAIFYPETWVHYVIPPLKALGWATLMFLIIAGSGMYAFLRVIGLRPLPSTLGAITFMLNGFFVGWMLFPSVRSVGGWLPVMLLGFEKAVRTRRNEWLGVTAAATGMQFLAGHLQISAYVLIAFTLYVSARILGLLIDRADVGRLMRLAALAVAALVVGGLLAGGQLGPTLEFTRLNYRVAGLSYQAQLSHALAPPQLLLGLMPDIYGNPADGNHWGADLNTWWGRAYRVYSESACYFGVAPLVLAIAGLVVGPRRQSWFWLALLVIALALAFGTPMNAVLYHLVPGYEQLSGIGRAVLLACTAGAVLAALGCEAVMSATEQGRDPTRAVSAVCVVLLVAGLAGGLAVWVFTGSLEAAGMVGVGTYTLAQIGRFAALLVAAWALVIWAARSNAGLAWWAVALLVAVDLGVFMQKLTPEGRTEYLDLQPDVVTVMQQEPGPVRMASVGPDFLNRMAPNTQMIFDLQSVQGSESLIYAPYYRLLTAAQSERYGFEQIDPAHPLLDLMAVRFLAATVDVEAPGWRPAGSFETRLYENGQATPRAFLAREIVAHPDQDIVFAAVTAEDADPLVINVTADVASSGPVPHDGWVRITDYQANSVRVDGEMPAGAWLVLADVAYPGWRAFVDGVEAPIIPADLVRRAVYLPKGARSVRFVYLPASFTVGMFAALTALGALTALAAAVVVGGRVR